MNRQQELLLAMLGEIHDICVAHDIKYFLWAGTLIGALRNEGFLPWDDDADIMMPYDEWKRFEKACETDLPPNRHLGACDIDERYSHIVPRYVATDTTAIHTCQSLRDDVAGEAIDIFILDPIADGEGVFESYIQDMYLYSSIVNYANVAATRFELDAERYREYLEIEREQGRAAVVELLEANLARHFDADGHRYAWRWQSVTMCYERSWFAEQRPVKFEGIELFAPNGANEYLSQFFGEDWPEVPGSITASKHKIAASLDIPCSEALELFEPPYDREELYEQMCERKYRHLQLAPERNAIKDGFAAARARVAQANVEAVFSAHRDEFDRALAEEDYGFLAVLLEDYLKAQTSRELIGRYTDGGMYRTIRPAVIGVADDVFEAGLLALLHTGRIRFVGRLLDARLAGDAEPTARMREVREAVDAFHAATFDFERGDVAASLEGANALLARFGGNAMFWKLKCACLNALNEADPSEGRLAELEGAVAECLGRWPADGFFIKQRGDCLLARGHEDEAREAYLVAAESTRNGFALHDIFKKTGYNPRWLREPAWAASAGVAAWSGPEPERAAAPVPETAPGVVSDPRQLYLLDLIGELAAACEALSIRYALAPALAEALFVQGALPARVEDYAIVLGPREHERLFEALKAAAPDDRHVDHAGASDDFADWRLRYHGLDSISCELAPGRSGEPDERDTLFVTVLPLEAVEYPHALELAFRQFWAKRALTKESIGRRSWLYWMLHGIDPEMEDLAGALRRLAMKESWRAKRQCVRAGGEALPVGRRMLDRVVERTFAGRTFSVPEDLSAYVAGVGPCATAAWLALSPRHACSSSISYGGLVESGSLDPELYARDAAVREQLAEVNVASARFRKNYAAIKAAVKAKERALGKQALEA